MSYAPSKHSVESHRTMGEYCAISPDPLPIEAHQLERHALELAEEAEHECVRDQRVASTPPVVAFATIVEPTLLPVVALRRDMPRRW